MAQLTTRQALDQAVKLQQAGHLREAEKLYRSILASQPDLPDALHNLALLAHHTGHNEAALQMIQRVIALRPTFANAHSNHGNILAALGKLDEAIEAQRQAITLDPKMPWPYNNLGTALRSSGMLDEAAVILRRAIELKPDYAEAHANLGTVLAGRGELQEAIASLRRSIELNDRLALAHNSLGAVLLDSGDATQAVVSFENAARLAPTFAPIHNNLGNALKRAGELDQAILAYEQALQHDPRLADAHNNLGEGLKDRGELTAAIKHYRLALEASPGHVAAHSNLLLCMHYASDAEANSLAEEHRNWNTQHARPIQRFDHPTPAHADDGRRLRIGYVSPDMRSHAVARFLLPLLSNHDHRRFEIFGYASVRFPDAMTQRLRDQTDTWRNIIGLTDEQAANLIRQDQIDILVDLAGHTADNRLLIFARKPAPIQVTYLGYPNTTGLEAMDYRLADVHADPPGTDALHCEKLIRLNPCAWCFEPPIDVPLPVRESPPITFGCFNTFAKVTDPMLAQWAQILHAVPHSRLLLKSAGLASQKLRTELKTRFTNLGIDPDRVALHSAVPGYLAHMQMYGQIDIALDTFPYHGTTTTCEALWMAVPVITLAGQTHVSRVGVSLLTNVGLPELIAQTPEQYIAIAANLANDRSRLNQLHAELRQMMEKSPLRDAAAFARQVEASYLSMWNRRFELEKTSNGNTQTIGLPA
jgi:predicted O-linked N-acetylglucosamine transferase (SPINDLY family)